MFLTGKLNGALTTNVTSYEAIIFNLDRILHNTYFCKQKFKLITQRKVAQIERELRISKPDDIRDGI